MAVWCEKDGNNIMITCPQDFESLVDPGVYNAMREYFGFGLIGSTLKSEERIEELEEDLNLVLLFLSAVTAPVRVHCL